MAAYLLRTCSYKVWQRLVFVRFNIFSTVQNCKITAWRAILFPLLPVSQEKKTKKTKTLLDFHYWILNTPAWEHCLKIKEQMADIMEVPKWLKQLPTALNKPCALTLPRTDLHTVILEPPKITPDHHTSLHSRVPCRGISSQSRSRIATGSSSQPSRVTQWGIILQLQRLTQPCASTNPFRVSNH